MGNEVDKTGLGYFNARYYRYDLGRFLTPDPEAVFNAAAHIESPAYLYPYAYGGGDPVNHPDGSGRFWDTIADVGFIVYDTYRLAVDGPEKREENLSALAADAVGLAIPFATGAGQAVRAGYKAARAAKAARRADRANDARRAASGGNAARRAARSADKAKKAVKTGKAPGCRGSSCRRGTREPGCFAAGTEVALVGAANEPLTLAIEDIQLGARVRALEGSASCDESAREGWVAIHVDVPGYGEASVELLRAPEWAAAWGVEVGSNLPIRLEDLRYVGLGVVTRLQEVDVPAGPGCLVTARTRSLGSVLEVATTSGQTLQATPGHPLFSESRRDWLEAEQLVPGERLRTESGTTQVASVARLPNRRPVFNLEVDGQHSFYVGAEHIWAHNVNPAGGSCGGGGGEPPPNMSPPGAGRRGAFREAKRKSGVPVSQQPSKVGPNLDPRGKPQAGRTYEFEVPAEGGGRRTVRIRDDAAGHDFGAGNPQNRGPHFNDEAGNHFDY